MILLAKIVALLITALGMAFVVNPALMDPWIRFWTTGKRWYGIGILRIAVGIICLLAAFQARTSGILSMLALLFLASGVFVFVVGSEKLKIYISWWADLSALARRLLGVVTVAFGVMMIFAL